MHKRILYLIIILFIITAGIFTLSSCVEDAEKSRIEENIQKYINEDNTALPPNDNPILIKYPEEKEYIYYENEDSNNNIYCISSPFVLLPDNRIYYMQEMYNPIKSARSIAYIDKTDGSTHFLCPDPLCGHTESSCVFDFTTFNPWINTDNNKIILSHLNARGDETEQFKWFQSNIREIDYINNKINVLYDNTEDDRSNIYIKAVTQEYILFTEDIETEYEDGRGKSFKNIKYFKKYDRISKKTEVIATFPDLFTIYFVIGEKMIASDIEGLKICGWNLENITMLAKAEANQTIDNIYYDADNDYLYFIRKDKVREYDNSGELYRVKTDGSQPERIQPENDNFYNIQVTRDYIYYTEYDPLSMGGIDNWGNEAFDNMGGKLYRIPKESPVKSELVYDASGQIGLFEFTVIGNYIYARYNDFEYMKAWGEVIYYPQIPIVRINMIEKTIKYIDIVKYTGGR